MIILKNMIVVKKRDLFNLLLVTDDHCRKYLWTFPCHRVAVLLKIKGKEKLFSILPMKDFLVITYFAFYVGRKLALIINNVLSFQFLLFALQCPSILGFVTLHKVLDK